MTDSNSSNHQHHPSYKFAHICTIIAILLGILVAWLTGITALAAGIIIGGIILGIKQDQRLKSWLFAIMAIIVVNAASGLYTYQILNFGLTMTLWVLVPTFVILFSGSPHKQNTQSDSNDNEN